MKSKNLTIDDMKRMVRIIEEFQEAEEQEPDLFSLSLQDLALKDKIKTLIGNKYNKEGGKKHILKEDDRYYYQLAWCGYDVPMYLVYFCREWIETTHTLEEAEKVCLTHKQMELLWDSVL